MGCSGCGGRGGKNATRADRTYCAICGTRVTATKLPTIGVAKVCPRCKKMQQKIKSLEDAGRKKMIAKRKENKK